jgi:polyisoprenoid-binding protein YceI
MITTLRVLALAVAALAGDAAAQSTLNTNAGLAPAGRYRVVRDHTQAIFSIMHLGMSPYFGRMSGATGFLTFDPRAPERSNVSVELDAKSVSTTTDFLSRQLCGEDVLNCAKFPRIAFRSRSIARTGSNTGDIAGDLTISGVTRPAVLRATFHGGMQGPLGQDNYQLGFSAEATISRGDFGLTKMIWAPTVGDEIKLLIAAEFEQDKS